MKTLEGAPEWLTPAEVAGIFRVDQKTIARWNKEGKLPAIRTPGNHRRYKRSVIEALLNGASDDLQQ